MPTKKVSQLNEAPFALDDKIVVNASGVTSILKTEELPGALDLLEDKTFTYVGGNLTQVAGDDVTKTFSYDGNGNLQTVVITSAAKTVTKTFAYDLDGNLVSTTIS